MYGLKGLDIDPLGAHTKDSCKFAVVFLGILVEESSSSSSWTKGCVKKKRRWLQGLMITTKSRVTKECSCTIHYTQYTMYIYSRHTALVKTVQLYYRYIYIVYMYINIYMYTVNVVAHCLQTHEPMV